MRQEIDYYKITGILSKIGIVLLGIILFYLMLRYVHKNIISKTHKVAKANNKVLPTVDCKLTPPPPLHLFGRSRAETIAINAFSTILYEKGYDWQKIIIGYRPEFLKNPETGRRLEIDAFFPELRLGIEYNGIQHYKFPNHIHEEKEEFDKTLFRDQLKNKLARENNVKIISIPYYIGTCSLVNGEHIFKKSSDKDKWEAIKNYLDMHMSLIPKKTSTLPSE